MSEAAMPPQAVVFDFGGVLFRWKPLELVQTVLPQHARDEGEAQALVSAVFQSFAPGSDWSEFDRGALTWDAVATRIAGRTGLPQADVEALMSAIPPHLAPMPSSVAWLQALAETGVPLYFLSNMPLPYADYLRREHTFLGHFLDGVFSCHVGQIKPNADIFETTAQHFGLDPARTVFIDDSLHNVNTARSLGWRAVQFVDAAQCQAELADRRWL